ncbi:hypothetical protein GCM10010306_098640 [Streptomyces umbrinus]|nr:hypothetical protein GCM10010306_098640 [Streptomyces umbrinus]
MLRHPTACENRLQQGGGLLSSPGRQDRVVPAQEVVDPGMENELSGAVPQLRDAYWLDSPVIEHRDCSCSGLDRQRRLRTGSGASTRLHLVILALAWVVITVAIVLTVSGAAG